MKQKLASLMALIFMLGAYVAQAESPTSIIAFGDSITAGYGLNAAEAYPALLENQLNAEGLAIKIQNAGVSGDTTEGGLARLDWTLAGDKPDLFLLALGANDALRGIDPAITRKNLRAMLTRLKEKNVKVLLVGMMAPRNMGTRFSHDYDTIYSDLAREFHVPLDPFLLEGVAMDASLNQGDGLHPNAKGAEIIARRLKPLVRKALATSPKESASPKD